MLNNHFPVGSWKLEVQHQCQLQVDTESCLMISHPVVAGLWGSPKTRKETM